MEQTTIKGLHEIIEDSQNKALEAFKNGWIREAEAHVQVAHHVFSILATRQAFQEILERKD